jgi:hypothetical protein
MGRRARRVMLLERQKMLLVVPSLPVVASASCLYMWLGEGNRAVSGSAGRGLTIVSLRDAVLDTPAFCKIGNLGPVLVGVCVGTESAAVGVTR